MSNSISLANKQHEFYNLNQNEHLPATETAYYVYETKDALGNSDYTIAIPNLYFEKSAPPRLFHNNSYQCHMHYSITYMQFDANANVKEMLATSYDIYGTGNLQHGFDLSDNKFNLKLENHDIFYDVDRNQKAKVDWNKNPNDAGIYKYEIENSDKSVNKLKLIGGEHLEVFFNTDNHMLRDDSKYTMYNGEGDKLHYDLSLFDSIAPDKELQTYANALNDLIDNLGTDSNHFLVNYPDVAYDPLMLNLYVSLGLFDNLSDNLHMHYDRGEMDYSDVIDILSQSYYSDSITNILYDNTDVINAYAIRTDADSPLNHVEELIEQLEIINSPDENPHNNFPPAEPISENFVAMSDPITQIDDAQTQVVTFDLA